MSNKESMLPIIKTLIDKKIINVNQYKMANNIADTIGTKIESVLLEKGFISEEILYKIIEKSDEETYKGILPNVFFKYLLKDKSVFEDINIKKNDYHGVLCYIKEDVWNKMLNDKKVISLMKKLNLTEKDRYFILTNEPFNLFKNNTYKVLSSKNPMQKNPKIFFLPSNKYKEFLIDPEKRWRKIEQMVELLNSSDIEENISSGLVNKFIFEGIMLYSIEVGASDIHVEPDIDTVNIRIRKDGVLNFLCSLKKGYIESLFSLINEKTEQNETDGHKPLDGQFNVKHPIYGEINLRWGENRTIYGHHIVMRILNNDVQGLTLEKINYTDKNLRIIRKMLQEPNGIILITGPTGSGKTNTLAAVLKTISGTDTKVLSLEDPVEIKLPLIQQVQVNPKNKLTVASGLKSFLRQDPDVMFIGEIRDGEMGEHAIVGAMTGHLMLATLHTNDALSSIIRLEDMGIQRGHIANTVKMVIAQRLLRVLCNDCKKKVKSEFIIDSPDYSDFSIDSDEKIYESNSDGCSKCSFSGYSGRTPIAEIFVIDKQVQSSIIKGEDLSKILEQIKTHGFSDLKDEAIMLVNDGKTDIAELIRVLGSSNQDTAFQYKDISGVDEIDEF